MITDCPDLKEVSDFHFLQLRTLRLVKENEKVPVKSLNLIATASQYGILFIGIEGGFKVLKLEDILTVDDDKENRSIEENYNFTFVRSPTPVLLALNSSQKTLAVCAESAAGAIVSFYSVSTLAHEGANWQPYACASPRSGVGWCDFIWNPASEGLYACCLSDGSLHIEELSGVTLKSIASLPSANATSVCWSPKGKQLVAGRYDGAFVQYKPTLQEVKSVLPPNLEDSPLRVSSICWISNTSFAVVYVAADTPYLFMVSTPKDSPVSYTNFYDVCLGINSSPNQKYFLHLESQWGILICASVDSIEIAVLGDMPNWVQWDVKEDGKALLPGKSGATHAIGAAAIYSSTRKINISENECYAPMPIIFFVTNNGLLVSFHMINSNAQAVSLVSPPLNPLEWKRNAESSSSTNEAGRMVLKRSSSSSVQPSPSSAFTVTSAAPTAISTFQHVATNSTQPSLSTTFNVGSKPAFSDTLSIQPNARSHISPAFGTNVNTPFSPSDLGKNSLNSQEVEKPTPTLSRPWEENSSPQANREKVQAVTNPLMPPITEQISEAPSYRTAIMTEIQSFSKELQDLKQLQITASSMGSEKDMAALKVFALNLHNFQKDISETMQSLNSDIFTLKNVLLESFVMVEEACSRLRRRNDHSYITMLKERALDPVTAKRMQTIQQHYQYLSNQLSEVNDKLDQDWINLLSRDKKSPRNNPNISSTEAIYKTIVNNQKIIHNLRKTVDMLSKKSEEKKLRGISKSSNWAGYHKRSTQEDLSKLADEFLQVKIMFQEEKEPPKIKKLSTESQNFLKEYLKSANIVTVRPTAVYSPSQSRLLSNAISSGDMPLSDLRRKDESLEIVSTPTKGDVTLPVAPNPETPQSKTPTGLPSTFGNSVIETTVLSYAPVYEPITPPESVPFEPIDKTVSSNKDFKNSLMKEKNAVLPAFKSGITITSTPDVSIFKQKDMKLQGTSTNLFSSAKNIVDIPPNVSLSVSSKIPSQSSVEIVPPAVTSSSIFSQTNSFMSEVPKSTENLPLSFFSSVSKTPFSFSLKDSQPSLAEQKKEADVSKSQSTVSDAKTGCVTSLVSTSMQEVKITATSPAPIFQQSDTFPVPKSSSFSNLSFGQSTSFLSPGTKASVFPSLSLPENKNQLLSSDVTSSAPQVKSSAGFSFESQTSTTSVANTSVSLPEKEPTAVIVTPENETSCVQSSPDKIIVVDAVSPSSPQIFSVQTADNQKLETLNILEGLGNSLLHELTVTPIAKTDNLVVTSSQGSATVSFGDLSVIQQAVSLAESNVSFQTPVITSVTSVTTTSTETSSVSPSSSISTVTTAAPSVTSAISVVSQAESAVLASTTTVAPTIFGQTTTSVSSPPLFGQGITETSATLVTSTPVSPGQPDSTTPAPAFGFQSPPLFGPPTSGTSFFGATKPDGSVFGQAAVTQSSAFGQTQVTSSGFGTSGGFFSQTPSFGLANTITSPDSSSQTSAFSFGKSTFGQPTSGSFGLAKSLFGQSTTTTLAQPTSPSSSFSFGQTTNTSSGTVFGQGAFFSGLGGKPSEENANKNVFGISSNIKPNTDASIFGNSGSGVFGSKGGAFSGGGSFSSGGGSVAQSGFGSFQQNTPQKPGGFGAAPAFGGAPTFGSPPAFGSPPSFGSGGALSSVFGQQQTQQPPQANFSNFASASTPTFGALASQTSGFGSPPPMGGSEGFGTQGSTFGAAPSPFGSSSFGGQSPSGFGNTSPPAGSSAFTQWRN